MQYSQSSNPIVVEIEHRIIIISSIYILRNNLSSRHRHRSLALIQRYSLSFSELNSVESDSNPKNVVLAAVARACPRAHASSLSSPPLTSP
jgi:hypothetical protein